MGWDGMDGDARAADREEDFEAKRIPSCEFLRERVRRGERE